MKKNQFGRSVFSTLVHVFLFLFLFLVGIRLVPSVFEYMKIKRVLAQVVKADGESKMRVEFERRASIDDIHSISGKDLKISIQNGKFTISFSYENEIHLFGPAYLVMRYAGQME